MKTLPAMLLDHPAMRKQYGILRVHQFAYVIVVVFFWGRGWSFFNIGTFEIGPPPPGIGSKALCSPGFLQKYLAENFSLAHLWETPNGAHSVDIGPLQLWPWILWASTTDATHTKNPLLPKVLFRRH